MQKIYEFYTCTEDGEYKIQHDAFEDTYESRAALLKDLFYSRVPYTADELAFIHGETNLFKKQSRVMCDCGMCSRYYDEELSILTIEEYKEQLRNDYEIKLQQLEWML